ncbi:MAG: hypothetical protein A4E68_00031 [Syntrophaceae bacterium PtaB.Bin095]|nr:MAG: hypothetical protein A4E68_00031 [Syntrophaceae bacterium PtaB.Bin095]
MKIPPRIGHEKAAGEPDARSRVGRFVQPAGRVLFLDIPAVRLQVGVRYAVHGTSAPKPVRREPSVPEGVIPGEYLAVYGPVGRTGAAVVDRAVSPVRAALLDGHHLLIIAHVVGGLDVGAEDVVDPPGPFPRPSPPFEDPRAFLLEIIEADAVFKRLCKGVIDGIQLVPPGDARDAERHELCLPLQLVKLSGRELEFLLPEGERFLRSEVEG